MFSISNTGNVRRDYPQWHQRGRIRKTDADGKIVAGEYACGGELVHISPRYQKNGTNFRVRPDRPAYFFSTFLLENGLLPVPLTAEECAQEWALELLDPLWEQFKGYFPKLESPCAASDTTVVPSHRVGFSFNIAQVLIEQVGGVKTSNGKPTLRPSANGSAPSTAFSDAIKRRIEEQRAKAAAAKQEPPAPTKKKG